MLLRRFTNYLLTHRWQALLLTLVISIVPVFGVVGIIFAALITLVKGPLEGALFTLAATCPYFFGLVNGQHTDPTGLQVMLWGAISVAVMGNVLTWALAVMLKRHASWSTILQVAALIGVLIISVVHLAYPNVASWWGDQLQASFKHAQKLTGALTPTVVMSDAQIETIATTKYYASGFIAAAILFNAIIQLIVGRWWQAMLYKPASLARELHNIRLSPLAGVLFLLSISLAYWGNMVVIDIMPIMYLLFAGAGLSVVHYVFGLMKTPYVWFWLVLFYLTLILSFPISIFILAIVALLDIWLDIRKRLKKL